MGTILSDVKPAIGVDEHNLAFDGEILAIIAAVFVGLAHVGVDEFDDFILSAESDWPVFASVNVGAMVKQFTYMKVRSIFDPIPSSTIAQALGEAATQFEGRIAHEIDEVNNV